MEVYIMSTIKKILEYKSDAINTYNCEVIKDIDLSIKKKLDRSGFGSFIIKVPVRKKGMTGSGKSNECHLNCELLVKRYGGSVLRGMLIEQIKKNGINFSLLFHSIWITPENNAVDVTANNFAENPDFVYFIPLQIQNPRKNINFDINAPFGVFVHANSITFAENSKSPYINKPISFFKLKNLVTLESVIHYFEDTDYLNQISKIGGFRNVSSVTKKAFSIN
jgi:hypothetical protein